MPNTYDSDGKDSWSSYRRQVMDTLDRLSGEIDKNEENAKADLREAWKAWDQRLKDLQNDAERKIRENDKSLNEYKERTSSQISALQVKCAAFGSIGGLLVSGALELILKLVVK